MMRLGRTTIELMMLRITLRTASSIREKSAISAAPVKLSLSLGGLMKEICAAPIRGIMLVSGHRRIESLPDSVTCLTPC